jgi:flagellin
MSLVLNTNINSLLAQNSLTSSGNTLSTALEQLSSGLRINTAADDAAGYAIVQGMTSQIGGLNQAAQNANDGVALAQTASGALQEVTSDLQSMRDLAVESLNATNSTADRADLDTQFQQLKADINQVSQTANFNGVNLLDGSFQGATFQIGANAGQTITVASVASSASTNLGQLYSQASTGVTAGAYTALNVANGDTGTITITTDQTANPGVAATVTTGTISLTGNQATDDKTVAAAINQISAQDGGLIATVAANGGITLSSTTQQTPTAIAWTGTGNTVTGGANVGTEDETSFGLVAGGVALTAAAVTATTATTSFLGTGDVKTVDDSNLALSQIDAALQQVATTGAQLGAYQNRFTAAISGINTDSTNLSSARSGIQDTDYAAATSALSKAQILQQASTAMVAQANTVPQNVLTLLQKLA